ncbi:MAG: hypothetical protein MI866_07880, partial [Bacteroidales bacterium]|nr:hypothetical protein [Bacteroidales bacterium]
DNKIKVPIGSNPEDFMSHQQFRVRGKIGPIVEEKNDLSSSIDTLLNNNHYKTDIAEFRKDFVYNLGTACDAVRTAIIQESERF